MKAAWTRNAQRRLQQIHDYIAQDQPGNANDFAVRLIQRADLAAIAPNAGRLVPRYGRTDIREVFEGEYRIVYRIRVDRIEVVTVRHMSRLLPRDVRKL